MMVMILFIIRYTINHIFPVRFQPLALSATAAQSTASARASRTAHPRVYARVPPSAWTRVSPSVGAI